MNYHPKIVELDFGMGNIRSLQKAFEYQGADVEVIQTPEKIERADALLIPGDGAFHTAMVNLKSSGFYDAILSFISRGKPVLGVCIGFQVLFDSSDEFGAVEKGFGVFSGHISKFSQKNLIIPHMGWNKVTLLADTPLFNEIPDNSYFYFVHSYAAKGVHEHALAKCEYGETFTAVVQKDNVFAAQFHPEKSYLAGLQMIKNFIKLI